MEDAITGKNRLRFPSISRTAHWVNITFEGMPVAALEGETVAAALTAAGIVDLRLTRQGRPRGIFCGMGVCFDCIVSVDGRRSQRACLTKVRDGMRICRQAHADADAASDLQPLAEPPSGPVPTRRCELLIVGAGPAGLAAAEAAARLGVRVTVVDERPEPGGQYYKQLASSHRFADDVPADAQFADGRALIERVRNLDVDILSGAMVWNAVADETDDEGRKGLELDVWHDGRATRWRPDQLIVATGAYERPYPVPGWTLPGFMTTGAAQTLARSYCVAPGSRILIAGNGPLNLQVACELARGGANVVAVAEAASAPGVRRLKDLASAAWVAPDLMRQGLAYLRFLKQRGIPVLYGHALVSAEGQERVQGAIVGPVGRDGALVPGHTQRFEVDAVCAGYGFIPSTDLTRLLGCAHRLDLAGQRYLTVIRDADGATSCAGVFVVGDCGDIGGARIAVSQGALAGLLAARNLGKRGRTMAMTRDERRLRRALRRDWAFQRALWRIFSAPPLWSRLNDPAVAVCRCEDVTASDIKRCLNEGHTEIGAVKRLTRAGMGRCQGRYCGPQLARLCAEATGQPPDAFALFAPRFPAKPLPLAAVACEKGEWSGHGEIEPPRALTARSQANATATDSDVVVIGAGILGSCTAYYLAKEGLDVVQLERGQPNGQASGGNAGSLHVQLLSYDFGDRAIKGGKPAAETLPLQRDSARLWPLLEKELGCDLEIRITGGLMVGEDEATLDHLRRKAALERSYGVRVELISAAELRSIAPAVSKSMLGAAWCPEEGKINPMLATPAINRAAVATGVRLLANTEVLAIERTAKGFSMRTSRGEFRAPRVLNAAGAWSSHVAAMLGIRLPTRASPLQMIVTEPAPALVGHLIAHANRHLTLKQAENGNLIIGGGWRATIDSATQRPRVRRDSFEGNLWVASHVLPALQSIHVIRSWAATNVSIDGAPILGETPGVPGFYNAVTVNGITLGPIIGTLTAQMIRTGCTTRDLSAYLLSRF
jgi:glycine/D-amino acid oxidase-like deaminating enzyme